MNAGALLASSAWATSGRARHADVVMIDIARARGEHLDSADPTRQV
jgi:hypothetical protein